MVIRGGTRGNARQLGHYLLTKSDNEAIRVFEVDSQLDADQASLHRSLYVMGLSSELSRSEKALYHAQINPAPGEEMNDDRWLEATDILAQQLGLENQRRAIVLHTKKGRTHAHVVWERFDHEQGRMVSDSFSRLAQDRARKEMELTFGHEPTPHRNKHRPELKASLLALWNQTATGAEFVKAARENNYWIASGSGRDPYVVVDENGRSYNLARQLKGIRLKDIRQRLRHESLLGEKDAIVIARNAKADSDQQREKDGTQQQSLKPNQSDMRRNFNNNAKQITQKPLNKQEKNSQKKTATPPTRQELIEQEIKKMAFEKDKQQITGQQPKLNTAEQFKANQKDIGTDKLQPTIQTKPQQQTQELNPQTKAQQFTENQQQVTQSQSKADVKDQFEENKEATKPNRRAEKEKERQSQRAEFKQRMAAKDNDRSKDKDRGPEIG